MQQLAQVLDQEATVIQGQISELQQELELIDRLKDRHSSGFGIHQGGRTRTRKVTPAKKTPSKRKGNLSTMDMARQVLDNNGGKKGSELSFQEIRTAVKETFGVEPAISLNQMLYKRAKVGAGFYRTSNGKYGRSEWKTDGKKAA